MVVRIFGKAGNLRGETRTDTSLEKWIDASEKYTPIALKSTQKKVKNERRRTTLNWFLTAQGPGPKVRNNLSMI